MSPDVPPIYLWHETNLQVICDGLPDEDIDDPSPVWNEEDGYDWDEEE